MDYKLMSQKFVQKSSGNNQKLRHYKFTIAMKFTNQEKEKRKIKQKLDGIRLKKHCSNNIAFYL